MRGAMSMIKAKAVAPHFEPMNCGRDEIIPHLRVLSVDDRLLGDIEETFVAVRVIAEKEPLAVRAGGILPGGDKRRMCFGDMISHEVEDNSDVAQMSFLYQLAKIGNASQARFDARVIGWVIAVMGGTGENWVEPHASNAQIAQIV